MMIMAIDGACRRNGKPSCVASGGVFMLHFAATLSIQNAAALAVYEVKSTNQRGEMLALLEALRYVKGPTNIVTDSEYLFNAMTKNWCYNWENKGWVTAADKAVKNQDLWEQILEAHKKLEYEVNFYYIKGHVVSIGKVTASKLLSQDPTGRLLYDTVNKNLSIKPAKQEEALELSVKNNGFELEQESFKLFITMNTVADAIATQCVEKADALIS